MEMNNGLLSLLKFDVTRYLSKRAGTVIARSEATKQSPEMPPLWDCFSKKRFAMTELVLSR
jgi:hypothetical protein